MTYEGSGGGTVDGRSGYNFTECFTTILSVIIKYCVPSHGSKWPELEVTYTKKKNVKIDAAYVNKQLTDIVKNQDLSRYIL